MKHVIAIMTLFLVVLGSGCGTPERMPFVGASVPVAYDWRDIKQTAQRVQLKTLPTGRVQVPVSGVLNTNHPATQAIKEKSLWVDVYAHWLRHPVKGDFLIDSGLDERFKDSRRGSLKGIIAPWIVENSDQDEGQDIASWVKRHDIDLQGVFLTHVHGDHSSGLPALKRGVPIYIGEGEPLHQYPLIMYNDHFDAVETLFEMNFQQGIIIKDLGLALDIWGDGSLWAIPTPGHTRGHVSFLVNGRTGWVLITGDASHTEWGFKNNVIPGWSEDDTQAQESLERLRQFVKHNPDIKVIYGHEGA